MILALPVIAALSVSADPSLFSKVPSSADVLVEASFKDLLTAALRASVERALRRSTVSWRQIGNAMRLGVGIDEISLFASFGNRKGTYFTSLVRPTRRPAADSVLGRASTVGRFRSVGPERAVRAARAASARRGSWESAGYRGRVRDLLARAQGNPPVALYYVPDRNVADRDFPGANLRAAILGVYTASDSLSVRFLAHTPGGADAMRRHIETVVRLGKIAMWVARLASSNEKKDLLDLASAALDGFRAEAQGDWLVGEIPATALPGAGQVAALIVRALERHYGARNN